MDVYLVPIGRDRFECYYEAADDEEEAPHEGAPYIKPPGGVRGFFARMRDRFSQQLREAEAARHETPLEQPQTLMARFQRKTMRWIAERVAEQRLLWHLGRATEATLHAPDDLDAANADKVMRTSMQRDADSHLRRLVVHSLALLLAIPVAVLPGPNVIGYLFTFTVVGHFLAWRGARRALSLVKWQVVSSADLAEIGRALALAPDARHRILCDVADRLHLRRLATFVERMADPAA